MVDSSTTHDEAEIRNETIQYSKAPELHWYMVEFFLNSWSIMGNLVTKDKIDFLKNGKLLHEINNTIVALVPKNTNPSSSLDFRPISYCNTIYKYIVK